MREKVFSYRSYAVEREFKQNGARRESRAVALLDASGAQNQLRNS